MSVTSRSAVAGAAFVSCLLAWTSPSAARDLPAGGMTATEIAGWLHAAGLTATVKPDPTTPGDQIVSSGADGVSWDVYLYGCMGVGDDRRCSSIQYAAGWSGLNVSPDKVIGWDRDKRYVRAYIDNRGHVWGEYDVDISPGGTWEQLAHSLEQWRSGVADFKAYVGE
jgi:hypothetical protein